MQGNCTAALVAVAIIGALSACASDGDRVATTATSLAAETAASVAPAETETTPRTVEPTTAPPATTSPEADEPPVATTTTEATTTTTSDTSDLAPAPPEAGEPNTVTIVFEDGEMEVAPVSCDSDPDQDFFEFSFRSGPNDLPHFELLFFNTGEKVANWRTESEVWLVSPTEGSIDVAGDPSRSPVSGTGVFLKADLTEDGEIQFTTPSGGQPLTTGDERAAAFTIVCADFAGDGQPLTTGG